MILLRGIVILLCISFGGAVGAEGNDNVPLVMHGLYSYLADASLFTDCQSGRSYPVALEGDNVALERAYLAVPHAPGEELLVTLEGRIVERPPMEGPGTVATLLPARFLAITPGAGCAREGEAAGLPVATVLGIGLQARDPQELQYLIVQRLLDRYAQEQGITVSTEEITSYLAAKQRFMKEDLQRREERRMELEAQLQTDESSGEAREALSRELAVLNSLSDMESQESADDSPEVRVYEEQIARSFILRHKINRALYRQYGGRVIFQQAGPEPLDAYRKFLEEHAEKGNFRIFDAGMEQEFWHYFTTDTLHEFFPSGSDEEAHAFDRILSESGR